MPIGFDFLPLGGTAAELSTFGQQSFDLFAEAVI
jgi:hypothetical protein